MPEEKKPGFALKLHGLCDITATTLSDCFCSILDAVPKKNKMHIFTEASILEAVSSSALRMAALLAAMRSYFVDSTGEESPFVKKIDELLRND